jgi:hypothetical protein
MLSKAIFGSSREGYVAVRFLFPKVIREGIFMSESLRNKLTSPRVVLLIFVNRSDCNSQESAFLDIYISKFVILNSNSVEENPSWTY